MRIEVLYFAAARERAGLDRESVAIDDALATLDALGRALVARHPALGALMPRLRFAINQRFAEPGAALREGDEVALIPPVAGGAEPFALTLQPLALAAVLAAVEGPERGGVVTFTGTVRAQSRGRRVRRLEYEAYAPMALARLAQIGAELEAATPGLRIAIHHRVGRLEVGEAAVVIAAAAEHRAEAFRACEAAIDRLKREVPIWKKEVYEDGAEWVGLGP